MVWAWNFFGFILFGLVQLFESVDLCSLPNLGSFWSLSLELRYSALNSFCLSFYMSLKLCSLVLSLFFSSFFSRWDNLYRSIFNFTNNFMSCPLKLLSSVHEGYIFVTVFFSSDIFSYDMEISDGIFKHQMSPITLLILQVLIFACKNILK